jgi:uncharacterized membrane protein YbhN (UPF0104 family)
VKWILRLLISAAIIGVLGWRTDWRLVAQALTTLHLPLWLLAAALFVGVQVATSWRWQLMAAPLGFDQPLRAYVAYTFIGMFFGLFLPSVGGDVVRVVYLDGGAGRRRAALLSVLADRALGLAVLLAVAWVALLLSTQGVPGWLHDAVWLTLLGGVAAGAALLWLQRWAPSWRSVRALRELCTLYGRHSCLAWALALSVLLQIGHIAVVALLGAALDLSLPWQAYCFVVPLVSLATLAPITINGIGVREAAMVMLLAPWGVSESMAVLLVFLWFITFTLASLAGAGYYLAAKPQDQEIATDCQETAVLRQAA